MAPKDLKIFESMEDKNQKVHSLKQIHQQLEKKVNKLNKRKTLTPREEIEKKQLQKEKLLAKDQMQTLLRQSSSKKDKPPSKF